MKISLAQKKVLKYMVLIFILISIGIFYKTNSPFYLPFKPASIKKLSNAPDEFIIERRCSWNHGYIYTTFVYNKSENYVKHIYKSSDSHINRTFYKDLTGSLDYYQIPLNTINRLKILNLPSQIDTGRMNGNTLAMKSRYTIIYSKGAVNIKKVVRIDNLRVILHPYKDCNRDTYSLYLLHIALNDVLLKVFREKITDYIVY